METLTFRAEQALLGAMLGQRGLVARLGYLETGDFALAQHRRVYAALSAASGVAFAGAERRSWRDLVAEVAGPEVDAGYLGELERTCPDAEHGGAYGTMVMQASTLRSLAADADELDERGTLIADSARRMFRAGAEGHREVEAYAGYTLLVAELLQGHASRFSPDTETAAGAAAVRPVSARARAEELILAALIQRHPDARQAAEAVSAEAFSDPVRREIFEAVAGMYRSGRGRDVDALTVDWQVASSRVPVPGREQPRIGTSADAGPSYVTRLAALAVTEPVGRTARALAHSSMRRAESVSGQSARPALHPAGSVVAATRPVSGVAQVIPLIPPTQPGHGPGPVQGR